MSSSADTNVASISDFSQEQQDSAPQTTLLTSTGFDTYAGRCWVYPNNLPVRGYQKTAVEMALFHNAMIVLPTGFGKTFIAAVVMYNFYRWYPNGTIIFVAPTRPLVAQQIIECKKISGIPSSACVELTGTIGAAKRQQFWAEKRVIFATPQVIENDLNNRLLPAKKVRCIVIDEAHRAQGNYAYVNIVRYLQEYNRNGFRVLALSATPGSDIQRVQQVMLNLYIDEIMFRSETSIDLMQFRNQKLSKAWTVDLVGKHRDFVNRFIALTDPIFKELHRAGLTFSGDSIDKVAAYTLIRALQRANSNEVAQNGTTKGRVKYLCSTAISLAHHFQLLTIYSIRVFYASVKRSLAESRSAIKTAMVGKPDFDRLLGEIERIFGDDIEPNCDKKATVDLLQGHPKLAVVKDLLIKHFEANRDKLETRAIVFSKYRDSVYDIVQSLKAYDPLLKAAAFVGQNSSGKSGSGMTQKEQAVLIQAFKAGTYNVIVATCVAEEGLDIGEVDLIICYDTSSSPISTTQRRGRTGRKRTGDVQTILTKGYEEKRLAKAGQSRRAVEDQLYKRENYSNYKYRDAPRMVPEGLKPVCFEHKVYPIDDEPPTSGKKAKTPKRTKKVQEPVSDEELDSSCTKKRRTKKEALTPKSTSKIRDEQLDDNDNDKTLSFTSAIDLLRSMSSSPDTLWE